jgi:chorismate lyase/3-hydroxybenzoate synthase
MDQQNKPSLISKLHVTNSYKSEPLMTFAALNKKPVEGAVAMTVPLETLCESKEYQEFWSDGETVTAEPRANNSLLKIVETAEHLVVSYQCNALSLFDAVSQVYQDAYTVSAAKGFQHLIRVWNYIDQINTVEAGTERYQTFCVARHKVLEKLQLLNKNNPAATAIGGHNGENIFVFLFSKQAGQVVENKRQISAWQYPEKYSPKQPRFSRAMQYGDLLMCSGTASVVGHETIHLNDLAAQFNECLVNIQALLDESTINVDIKSGLYRFYLRDKTLVNQVVELIKLEEIESYVVLEGDICRENLLIECEAVFQ